ncbi:hypothetical protein [Streptomyces sp. NPDC093060]|uniref:hypothetical protein n=1 Tax=Streptomyces sp. NPDC093060 TaxID=3366019 RepID=UPI0037F1688F
MGPSNNRYDSKERWRGANDWDGSASEADQPAAAGSNGDSTMPHVTVHISETALDGKAHSSAPARHLRGADPSFTVRYGKAAELPATGTTYTQDSDGVPGAD